MKPFKQLLIELNACEDAREWADDKSIEEAVNTCPRGDWMLWLAKKVNVGIRPLTLAKGKCANTVRHLMKDERSIKAVDSAIDFGNGLIEESELRDADAAAAYAAYAAAYAAYAAAYAADDAAAAAAAYAAYAAYAAAYSAAAAYAAYAAAYAAYAAAARIKNQLLTADICREIIGDEIVTKVNELLNQ